MITGELRGKVDRIWDAFGSGGITDPLEVIDQLTYLLFIRRLDDLHTRAENKVNRLGESIEDAVFPVGFDEQGRGWDDLRWSRFRDFDPARMHETVASRVFRSGASSAATTRRTPTTCATLDSRSPRRRCCPGWWTCSPTSRWPTGTPTATCTSTC